MFPSNSSSDMSAIDIIMHDLVSYHKRPGLYADNDVDILSVNYD